MSSVKALGLILAILILTAQNTLAQVPNPQYQSSFNNGINLFRQSMMAEAAVEFRNAQRAALNNEDWARALYWVILSQFAIADFDSAFREISTLERYSPNSPYTREMIFHRARAYYNLGLYEDALVLFQRYIDNTPETPETANRLAAAFFWMGESLFSMGHYNDAEKFYAWVISRYPASPRVEVSAHRLDIIRHKRIEAELLTLLRWSHEESLRTSEEYQRRLRTYGHTLNVYQRRIAELTASVQELQAEEPVLDIPDTPAVYAPSIDPLIERARQLGVSIDRLILDYEIGGSR